MGFNTNLIQMLVKKDEIRYRGKYLAITQVHEIQKKIPCGANPGDVFVFKSRRLWRIGEIHHKASSVSSKCGGDMCQPENMSGEYRECCIEKVKREWVKIKIIISNVFRSQIIFPWKYVEHRCWGYFVAPPFCFCFVPQKIGRFWCPWYEEC